MYWPKTQKQNKSVNCTDEYHVCVLGMRDLDRRFGTGVTLMMTLMVRDVLHTLRSRTEHGAEAC